MYGGVPARDGEFPYMVSIRDSRNVHICGGTIIADTWILTANACYSRSWFGYVRYGSNLLDDEGTLPVNTKLNIVPVNESIYNPHANDRPPYNNDCVLIRLSKPIPFNKAVRPVKLPSINQEWPYDKIGIILGWGKPQGFQSQQSLQRTDVSLYTDKYCLNYDFKDWKIPNILVMKCGGTVNTTYHCYNDYGGPLIVDGTQYGIISHVPGRNDGTVCGKFPGIYSPVSHFRKWIQNTTGI